MIEIVFAAPEFERLERHLLAESDESALILFAHAIQRSHKPPRLLVVHAEPTPRLAYTRRGPLEAELSPAVVLAAARRAERDRLTLIFAHSHPFADDAVFSVVDDSGESRLAAFLERLGIAGPHCSIVVARKSVSARELATHHQARVIEVGARRRAITRVPRGTLSTIDDRQVRALGVFGQLLLRSLHVGVIGVGGTGSVVATQLAHLGVGRLRLVDPDSIELTNLNRVVGATGMDLGSAKAKVLGAALSRVRDDVVVEACVESVFNQATARSLADLDALFLCTDNHGSRAVITQLAYQYLVPVIELGAVIRVDQKGIVTHVAGRVQALAPGLGCLVCSDLLDGDQVRRDLMSNEDLARDPYFAGVGEQQPAVVSFNTVLAGSAVSMFLSMFTGVGTDARLLLYDGLAGTLRAAVSRREVNCIICSERGALARGDSIPLPTRASQ